MEGRSIAVLRDAMAERGLKIGTGTLHRAVLGEVGNRLESLGKIAEFFGVTVDQLLLPSQAPGASYWPFSDELFDHVAELDAAAIADLEVSMWAHLRMPIPEQLLQVRREQREDAIADAAFARGVGRHGAAKPPVRKSK